MGLEFNATLIAQVVDLLILILFVVGIVIVISKALSFRNKVYNKIDKMNNELKELKEAIAKRQE